MGKVRGSIIFGIAVIAMLLFMALPVSNHVTIRDMGIMEDEEFITCYVDYKNLDSKEVSVIVVVFVDGNKVAEKRENLSQANTHVCGNGVITRPSGHLVFQVPNTKGIHEITTIVIADRNILMHYYEYGEAETGAVNEEIVEDWLECPWLPFYLFFKGEN